MKTTLITSLIVCLLVTSCSPLSTGWHEEPITEDSVTMNGSYENALESIVVKSHGWKVLFIDKDKGLCEWGFRVDLECKDHPDFQDAPTGARAWLNIDEIKYTLFDKDGFELTTLSLTDKNLGICFRDSDSFRSSQKNEIDLIKRAVRGTVNIKAGYHVKK